MNTYCPFVEKHRPTQFNDIVLDPLNKKILNNIIETSYFPNLLFYGPPGTGKTTTIINLINAYQSKLNNRDAGLMIHLNASDERGIDVIRNQINAFVTSKPLFNEGMKFVVLDEVDYMTKNAQQALRYLLQSYSDNVRFCLICNYISKIDIGLQNEFLKLRFNQLPKEDIIVFLNKISVCENLNMSEEILHCVQQLYKSDIRSMIYFIQLNQNLVAKQDNIINATVWERIKSMFDSSDKDDFLVLHNKLKEFIHNLSIHYNIDKKQIIKDYYSHCIRTAPEITGDMLSRMETVLHNYDCKIDVLVDYFIMDNVRTLVI